MRRAMAVGVVVLWLAAAGLATAQVVAVFDTSGLPNPPTTFEEQRLWDEIQTASRYPELAAATHLKLADYYERRGLSALAQKERAAAGAPAAPVSPPPAATAPAVPSAGRDTGNPVDPMVFELSAFPSRATNFEEQRILETLRDPNTLQVPALLAFAHRQLGRYYAARGRIDLAATEYGRAIVAYPVDPRGYQGLAALSEAAGVEASDGIVALRDVADRLEEAGYSPDGPPEPEPVVSQPSGAGEWQEVSAEFNRRMNYLYTSNAWSNVYRTVFTNLYGTR